MNPERIDKKLDDWLDAALAEYGRAAPPPGIEARAVDNLRSRMTRQPWWLRWQRAAWVAAAAFAVVVLMIALFVKRERPNPPDVAKHSDQELLLGVDGLLDREVPAALAPALVLTQEMVKGKKN